MKRDGSYLWGFTHDYRSYSSTKILCHIVAYEKDLSINTTRWFLYFNAVLHLYIKSRYKMKAGLGVCLSRENPPFTYKQNRRDYFPRFCLVLYCSFIFQGQVQEQLISREPSASRLVLLLSSLPSWRPSRQPRIWQPFCHLSLCTLL